MTDKDLLENKEDQEGQAGDEPHRDELPAENTDENEVNDLSPEEEQQQRIAELEEQVEALKDKNLRLFAEFENLKRRSARERIDLIKTAGQDIMRDLLPVLDDFERAHKAIQEDERAGGAAEGVNLIYSKLKNTLEQKGLKPMEALGDAFDAEKHEAVTEIPAQSEDQKGKVVDVLEKGYYLNDKIIRYAKVIVGK